MLSEYILLHYGSAEQQMPMLSSLRSATQFPKRCADLVIQWTQALKLTAGHALDLGCAVGGATFQMARSFSAVTGVDLSETFIQAATEIQKTGSVESEILEEGILVRSTQVLVDEAIRKKVKFRCADACNLPDDLVDFDAVLIANLLCRVPDPMAVLNRMGGVKGAVKPGGVLVVTTPFSWMEDVTPITSWLGGYAINDEVHFSRDGLVNALENEFALLEEFDTPLVIREHHRKYQLIFALVTVWQRKT